MKLILGIDTGGTYTDAVLFDSESGKIAASGKALTTKEDLSIGINAVLEELPPDLLETAQCLSLSTTLATNACVEDRGGRAKLIFIGAEEAVVRETGSRYGLPDASEIYFLDASICSDGSVTREPDWELFLSHMEQFLQNADSAAITAYQGIHNPKLEQRAKELLMKRFGLPVVCGHELFWSLNYIKRGASTLLNARLIPVIADFLTAIRSSMEKRRMDIPIVIVRSDGTLMSEAFSIERPVETILCGPASSVMGGMTLAKADNCLVVDMGGTTTDLALVRDKAPVKGDGGVTIGKWSTFVDSLYIHTFGLGGDSAVRLDKTDLFSGGISVGPNRMLPLCAAASRWQSVRQELEELARLGVASTHPLQEFLYLVRDISGDPSYSEKEREICRVLQGGALRVERLASLVGLDLYTINTKRLEQEGILMRCGFTPTDAMHVKGDFSRFDKGASVAAAEYLAEQLGISVEELCVRVYDQVKRKMYIHIVKALLENTDPFFRKELEPGLLKLIENAWAQREKPNALLYFLPITRMSLVGIGASIHLFLPDVAKALQTDCIIPDCAAVANAVGAVAGRVSAEVTAEIRKESAKAEDDSTPLGFYIFTPRQRLYAEDETEAMETAQNAAAQEAREEAERRGAVGEITVTVRENPFVVKVGSTAEQELCLSMRITATATGSAGF